MKVYDWSAKRSGDKMRVTGKDDDGQEVRLTGVLSVEVEQFGESVTKVPIIVAKLASGAVHQLVLS